MRWRRWFAWYPVYIKGWVWLRFVEWRPVYMTDGSIEIEFRKKEE